MEIAAETNRFLESAPALPSSPHFPELLAALGRRSPRSCEGTRGAPGRAPQLLEEQRPAPVLVLVPISGWSLGKAGLGDKESPLPQAWQPLQGGRAPGTPRTTALHSDCTGVGTRNKTFPGGPTTLS